MFRDIRLLYFPALLGGRAIVCDTSYDRAAPETKVPMVAGAECAFQQDKVTVECSRQWSEDAVTVIRFRGS
jgi:hypothetical protein